MSLPLYRHHIPKLNCLQQCYLSSIMGIKWPDKLTNNEVLWLADRLSKETMLVWRQMTWIGYLLRMDNN